MLAADIAFKHIGRKFRSLQYPNKNKTARPRGQSYRGSNGKLFYTVEPREWTLESFQFFKNGNIIVNHGQFYLHPDTEVELLND